MNTYGYVGGNPIIFIDPLGLLSDAAQKLVDQAMRNNNCNPRWAHDDLRNARDDRDWEALSKEGRDLRDAEHYLTNYEFVYLASNPALTILTWFTMGSVANPIWEANRVFENTFLDKNLQAPSSLSSLAAGYEGANDALIDQIFDDLNNAKCTCKK